MSKRKTKYNPELEATRIFSEAVRKFCNENTHLNAADGVGAMAVGMGSAAVFMMVSLNSTEEHILNVILQIVETEARDSLASWRNSHIENEMPWKGKKASRRNEGSP
jgi:hypothetical protein